LRRIVFFFLILFCFYTISETADQSEIRSFGLKLLDEGQYQSIPIALVPLSGELPGSVDLSTDMPPIQFQGRQASCVGWSVAYALRTYMQRKDDHWDITQSRYQFSPAFIYNQLAHGNCESGITFVDALNTLTADGASTMDLMPYVETDCSAQPTDNLKQYARNYRIAGYRRINIQDLNEIKAQLAAGFPVLIAVSTDDIFLHLGANEVWKEIGNPKGYHAIVVVGFNDTAQAFKVMNSWGNSWGTNGYGWINYETFRHVTKEAYIAAAFPKSQEVPTPSPQPQPQPVQPEAQIAILGVDHNVYAGTMNAGMNIKIRYTLKGYAGYQGQIVLHFYFENNTPVRAALAQYQDIYYNSAAGTQVFNIVQNDYTNYEFPQYVPYGALQVPLGQWNTYTGQYQYQTTNLRMIADLFVNNFGVAQSAVIPFSVSR
jgi:hypothetical protein